MLVPLHRVYCSDPNGCGSSCNEYQQGGSQNQMRTQCTPDDRWPANMCSIKITDASDGGDTSAGGGWIAGKVGERRAHFL